MMSSDLQSRGNTLLPQHVTEDELYSNFIPPPVPSHSQDDFVLPPPTFSTFLPPPVPSHSQKSNISPTSSTFSPPPVPSHSQKSAPTSSTFSPPPVPSHSQKGDIPPQSSTFSPPPVASHSQNSPISLSTRSATESQQYSSSSPPPLPIRSLKHQILLPALTSTQTFTEDHLYSNCIPPTVPNHSRKGDISLPASTSTRSSPRIKPCRRAPLPPVSNKAGNLCQSGSPTEPSSRIKPHRHAPPPPVPNNSRHPPPVPKSLQLRRHKTEPVIMHPYQSQEPSTSVPIKKPLSTSNKVMLTTGDKSDGGDKLSLPTLIAKYSQSFPLEVQVVKGFFGEHAAVASEEMYSIHSVKQTNVVTLKDFGGHKSYIMPFSSTARFGIIFQKEGSNSLLPVKFDSVGELIDSTPLPKLVCAKSRCCGTDNKSSVREGEILAIQGIQKGSCALKVVSVTDQKEKFLERECMGHFTTDPYCTQLRLPELVRFVPDPLPVVARMFPDAESERVFPEHVLSEPVLLVNQYIETFLIATPVGVEDAMQKAVVELPTSLDVEVRVIPNKSKKSTEHVYEELDTKVCMDGTGSYAYAYAAQPHLQTSINDTRDCSIAQFGDTSFPPATPSSAESLGKSSLTSNVEKLKLGTSPATVSTKTENHSHCQILEAETRMKLPLTPPPHPPVSTSTPLLTPPSRQSEIRRSELESLTKAEVLRLLDLLGMKKYQKNFVKESIDGVILVECDEPILQHELGVSSKQDRIKLMRIISGQCSALSILKRDMRSESDS